MMLLFISSFFSQLLLLLLLLLLSLSLIHEPKSENFQGNLKSDVKVKNFFTKFLNLKLKLKVIGKRNFH